MTGYLINNGVTQLNQIQSESASLLSSKDERERERERERDKLGRETEKGESVVNTMTTGICCLLQTMTG